MTDQPPQPRQDDDVQPSSNGHYEARKGNDLATKPSAETAKAETAPSDRRKSDSQFSDDDEGEDISNEEEDDDEEDDDGVDEDDDDEDEEEEEEEEPRLKYAPLTQHLRAVYRNGDATSAFLVAGDKMIVGTHNGNIHVLQLPIFQPLRVYHAHSASVTSISISPYPPPLSNDKTDSALRPPASQSLLDLKDVQLRNFARPVQAVALSPDFKTDRTYLSGGLAGQLILTVGGGPGRSTSTTTGTAAATASGWLGSMGLSSNSGKDTVLHSGEGTISCIKWSLSGKYVVWLTEHGIKLMRSKSHLESADSDHAWKRIGHLDRPQTAEWETMAGVWRGRVEWIDEKAVETDETTPSHQSDAVNKPHAQAANGNRSIERLLVGWGSSIWFIHVHPGGPGTGKQAGERTAGRAEIAKILLLVLAFCKPDEEDDDDEEGSHPPARGHKARSSIGSTGSGPSGGIRRRQNNLPPELRLIDLNSQAEVDRNSLNISRFERLSAADYHLGVLPAHTAASANASRGALEALAGFGSEVWNAAINPRSLFSSGASIRSRDSGDDATSGARTASTSGIVRPSTDAVPSVHPNLAKPGAKIFIHSPYECILGTKRDLADHLSWLVEHEQYQRAWELLDENPDILTTPLEKPGDAAPPTPSKRRIGTDDFFDDDSVTESNQRNVWSTAEKEKRRIGELWIQELVEEGHWAEAGRVCGKVLTTPDRWEKWVWTFAGAKKFDDIANSIPCEPMHPPLPSTIYEVILGHYMQSDKPRFRELLDRWSTELFDVNTVSTTLENQLKYRDVREDSVEDGEKGRDWRIVMESLARLYEASGRNRDALKCYIKLHDADSAFRLIREGHLAEAVADDIPSFIGLRVSPDRVDHMSEQELVDATSEAITLLVDEAQHGLVRPEVVVEQLQAKHMDRYLYFYLKGLWRGEGIKEHSGENMDRLVLDSQSLVDDFADLAVHLFATYERALLMGFLKTSTSYTFEKAVQECETFEYYDELVYLYSKTGQMKRALFLIIDRLNNVQKAIEFAKEQDDPDLWEDLLKYSMDKPSFIRALLEQVGTAINPITLVRRIPEGLEIKGLREGLTHMMKEHELQHSISSGAARILRSELASAQNELRAGQRRGIKFEVVLPDLKVLEGKAASSVGGGPAQQGADEGKAEPDPQAPQPGRCASCHELFTEYEMETLLGFACGHGFHVSHLLEMLHKGKRKPDIDLGPDEGERSRYAVGMKVMRARLLKDKVQSGCPICHDKAA
ncbi:vacuolar protein sorting-associated protein 41 [Purpureocillium lilacinum]|uniref:vacuolar protein sorting-associated protein 41 n=1 Tax=Purpureocillium lilacinum TaxID=33203 RepID=UPI0020848486|nr:vacuolar protein sorting-associated protein 41 [Purpureocillium lilacinum]